MFGYRRWVKAVDEATHWYVVAQDWQRLHDAAARKNARLEAEVRLLRAKQDPETVIETFTGEDGETIRQYISTVQYTHNID